MTKRLSSLSYNSPILWSRQPFCQLDYYQFHHASVKLQRATSQQDKIQPSVELPTHQRTTTIVPSNWANNFLIQPPRSPFKKLFIGTRLGEALKAMSFAKSVPKGLRHRNANMVLVAKIRPSATFPSHTPYKRPLRKRKRPPTSN